MERAFWTSPKQRQIFIDTSIVKFEEFQTNKRGGPFKHPNVFIFSTLVSGSSLNYRSDSWKTFSKSLSPNVPIPRFTTIHDRTSSPSQKVESFLKDTLMDVKSLQGSFVIAIDSAGLKMYGSGEWRSAKHKDSQRRWLKFYVAVDVKTNQVVAFSLKESKVHDSREDIALVEETVKTSKREGKKAKRALANKGYDRIACSIV